MRGPRLPEPDNRGAEGEPLSPRSIFRKEGEMLPFMFVLMQFAVLAYAIVGGAFLTFSDFVTITLITS